MKFRRRRRRRRCQCGCTEWTPVKIHFTGTWLFLFAWQTHTHAYTQRQRDRDRNSGFYRLEGISQRLIEAITGRECTAACHLHWLRGNGKRKQYRSPSDCAAHKHTHTHRKTRVHREHWPDCLGSLASNYWRCGSKRKHVT